MEELFEECIGAEIEVNTEEIGGPKPSKRQRKIKLLKEDDKALLLDSLSKLELKDVVENVISKISQQDQVYLFKDREKLWKLLQSNRSLMGYVVKGLLETYINVYKLCEKGKDKYCRFQLEWHMKCSLLLTDHIDIKNGKSLSSIHQKWLLYIVKMSEYQRKLTIP